MSWEDQGRQYHMWFGHGTAPPKLKQITDKIATTDDGLGERLRSVAQGAVGALAKAPRRQAEAQLQGGTLGRLTEAMTAWVRGSRMDAGGFASHFFGRAADDPVVATLRAAVSEASFATTQAQLAKASGDLAEAMKAVGLDRWPRFVADAQARARDPATVAAIEKSLQPPDLKRDAITPVYPVEKALAVGAAAATGGAAGLVGAAARAVGGAVASKILGDNPAASGGAPTQSPATPDVWTVPKDVTEKIPPEWGPGRPNRKGVGLRWDDPHNEGNGVRIDKGDPKNTQLSQRTDHVIVRSNGKIIGRDGRPIVGSITNNALDAHIPVNEYLTWSKWNKI